MQGVAVSLRKVQQSDHPGLPFDERTDRGALVLADYEVAFRKTEALAREGRVWLRSPCVMSLTGNVRPAFLGRLGC